MGLDIWSSDDKMNFHIGYFGFTDMRSFFILHYSSDLYDKYWDLVKYITSCTFFDDSDCPINVEEFDNSIEDLSILINHSDCDGELSSDECKLLKKCLYVDEDKIKSTIKFKNNPSHVNHIIELMYDFIDIVHYCADNDDIILIFG